MQYLVSQQNHLVTATPDEFHFKKEEEVQEILALNPQIVLNIPDLEMDDSKVVACRELTTVNGNIDVLYVTSNAEIIFLETKLIKNPESTRTVVAQVIDYIKGLSLFKADDFFLEVSKKKVANFTLEDSERFRFQIQETLRNGYFKVLIIGDFINPNILGMVESIQAAPHLGFTIYLVEINAKALGNEILLFPKVISNTTEIERSVIRLEIVGSKDDVQIFSEVPAKESKNSKPKLSWTNYIETVSPKEYAIRIEEFRNSWEAEFPNSISMGVVGFSVGIRLNKKRIPIQFIYNNRLAIFSELMKKKYNIPDEYYDEYKKDLQCLPRIYDEYVIGGKVEIKFSIISLDDLGKIFEASKKLARNLGNERMGK